MASQPSCRQAGADQSCLGQLNVQVLCLCSMAACLPQTLQTSLSSFAPCFGLQDVPRPVPEESMMQVGSLRWLPTMQLS